MANFPTCLERRETGQLRRKQTPRQDHGKIKIPHRDPVALLEASARGRIPSLIALKYQLMSASAFGFFRGAAPVMAYDLAALPNTGIACQLCGDAHVRNFGAFASPVDGRLAFDINDFDETTRGPFEWDVKRLATSLMLAGLDVGAKASQREPAVLAAAETYRQMIAIFRDKWSWAEPETRRHLPALVEFVEIWERHLKGAVSGEALEHLAYSEENLKPLFAHLEATHDRLQRVLSEDSQRGRWLAWRQASLSILMQ